MAYEVGRLIAGEGKMLVCGGLSGIMEAACRGAFESGGITLGILPGDTKDKANPYVTIPLPTGMGVGRNILVVRASDSMIAMDGGSGTLSEIAFALNIGVPVVDLGGWKIEGTVPVKTPDEALEVALSLAG
jgi:hypothetical protein